MERQEMDQKIGAVVAQLMITALLAVDVWVLITKESIVAQSLALVSFVGLLFLLIPSLKIFLKSGD